jgi:dUTP pyrophosphatase
MDEGIKKHIEDLKHLKSLGILDEETSKQIEDVLEEFESVVEEKEVSKEFKIKIKYINKSDNENPIYAKEGDSGFDLRANEGGTLKTLERKLVSTGLFFELPDGYELQIRPRSGLAYKNGVTVLNTPGTVDTGYRGEIKVLLVNLSNEEFNWEKGERIAQGVVMSRVSSDFGDLIEVTEISQSERGEGGFGSTGRK